MCCLDYWGERVSGDSLVPLRILNILVLLQELFESALFSTQLVFKNLHFSLKLHVLFLETIGVLLEFEDFLLQLLGQLLVKSTSLRCHLVEIISLLLFSIVGLGAALVDLTLPARARLGTREVLHSIRCLLVVRNGV